MTGVNPKYIPSELKALPQWVGWRTEARDGKATKVPYNPVTGEHASSTNPKTWTDFQAAYEAHRAGRVQGIGFVFTPDDPYVGIDLDKCANADGTVQEWAIDLIRVMASYTEISPSGKGAHIIVKGSLPTGARRKGQVEMYSEGRYFTMTGNHWQGTPTEPEERTTQLAEMHAHLFQPAAPAAVGAQKPLTAVTIPDDAALIERARAARNGSEFDTLWRGDWQGAGFSSQSEADLKLCNALAFWTSGDEHRIDRLFRQSGLMRDKWDTRHYNDGRTYGAATIAKATAGTTAHYGDRTPAPVLTLVKGKPTPETTPPEPPAPAINVPALPDTATAVYAHAAPCAEWLDDYINFAMQASPMTPRSFHETAGLFAGAVAIARRLVLRVSFTSIYPNIFALFIAPSTLYSKTTGLKLLNDLFSAADMEHYLLPQRMTPEAMLQELSLGVPNNLNLGDVEARKQWEKERAFAARRGWAIDEASGLFDSLKRDFNTGLLPMLLNLYECPDRMTEQTIGRWRVTVHDACVSFFGAATPSSMSEHMANPNFWSNGLWARFALVTPDQPPTFQFFPDALAIPASVSWGLSHMAGLFPTPTARLMDIEDPDGTKRKVVEVGNEVEASSVVLAPGVWEAWEAYTKATRYELLHTGDVNEELLYASYGRLGTHVIKIAMILATMDAETLPVTVELRHYARAQTIVETWRASVHRLRTFGAHTEEERQTDKILEIINKAGADGCPTRDIYKPLHLTSIDGRRLLDELARQGLAECILVTAANGRKVEKWRRSFSVENSPIVSNV